MSFYLVAHGGAVNRAVATIPDECFLEDFGLEQYQQKACNAGPTEPECLAACIYDKSCYQYLWFTSGDCWKNVKSFSAGGGYTMLDILNPECQMVEECHVKERMAYFYTAKSVATIDARECHAECAMFEGCKFWQWRKDNLCELRKEQRWTDNEEPQCYFGSRTCKI